MSMMCTAEILIVDDEKNVRLMLRNSLSDGEYSIRTAINGEDALQKMAEQAADVVLLDMKMPGMEGIQVLRELQLKYPDARVIMITAYGSVETAVEAMKLGAIDYLRKPFSPGQIRELVRDVLERGKLEASDLETVDELLQYAKHCLNQRRFTQALEYLQKAVAMDPGKPEPFNLLGIIYEYKGKINDARRMYRAALALNANYKPADANLTRVSGFAYTTRGMDLGDTENN
jgi:DNA-binding NtrC family response regulator